MDIENVLAENEKLIEEAEAALATAADFQRQKRLLPGKAADASERAISAQRLLDELLHVRARLLTQQAYLRAAQKLNA